MANVEIMDGLIGMHESLKSSGMLSDQQAPCRMRTMPSPSQPISPAARLAAVLGYQPETAANEFVHAVADIVTDNEDIAAALDAAYRARDSTDGPSSVVHRLMPAWQNQP